MTATDEPRRLLDELRKLACDINEKEIRSHSVITLNQGRYNRQFRLDMNHEWLGAWHAEFERILQAIDATLGQTVTGETSDGYHTFNELYHHRAVLFSVIVRDHNELAWKSKVHHDGTMFDGMFIVGIETPEGQATYHYDIDPYWEMFDCKELEQAPEWDGHTPADAIARIATLGRGTCHLTSAPQYGDGCKECSACGEVLDGYLFDEGRCPNCRAKVVDE